MLKNHTKTQIGISDGINKSYSFKLDKKLIKYSVKILRNNIKIIGIDNGNGGFTTTKMTDISSIDYTTNTLNIELVEAFPKGESIDVDFLYEIENDSLF